MSKWLAHVKKTMKAEKGKKKEMGKAWFKHVLKTAKHSYNKKGGADDEKDKMPIDVPDVAPPMGGRKRGGKTRRHRK